VVIGKAPSKSKLNSIDDGSDHDLMKFIAVFHFFSAGAT
jgi:hypothetical protein